jgi:hypothetical protein
MSPAEKALQLLRDLAITRITRDKFQGLLVEDALDVFDLERGYVRKGHLRDNRELFRRRGHE